MAVERVENLLLTCAIESGSGGVQVVFRDLVHWLEDSGRHVHLVYPAPLGALRFARRANQDGRPASYCPMPAVVRGGALLSLAAFLACAPFTFVNLRRLIRRHRIGVINCHYLAPHFIHFAIAARLLRVPLILSVHGADLDSFAGSGWLSRLFVRLIVRGSDRVVGCSAALAGQAAAMFPTAAHKVTWVHNGLDVARFAPVEDTLALPQPFVLCVCRHVRKKGVDTLIEAFARVVRKAPHLSLVLAGDGPLLDEHSALAQRLGIGRSVVFLGPVAHAQVSAIVARCVVFVLPSRAEPFGVALLEAAYHSRPIVCTRVGGVPEIVTDGYDGLMVEPDDPAAMAERILTLIHSSELGARLGAHARETLFARFQWRDRIKDYLEIFEGRGSPAHGRDELHMSAQTVPVSSAPQPAARKNRTARDARGVNG